MEGMTCLMRIPFARRGWFSGANSIRLREGDRLDANSIRLERLTLWVRNRSLWRGWRNWCEFHSLVKKGDPMKESHSLFREASWREYHSLRGGGLPWNESYSLWIGEGPWGEYDSLGEGNPLEGGKPLAGDYHPLGGDAPKVTPFAVERGVCWDERHSLDEFEKRATWRGWTPPWSESYSHWGLEPSCCRAQPGHLLTKGTSLMRTAPGSREIPDIGEWNSYNSVLHCC